jgi:hypothetical protein
VAVVVLSSPPPRHLRCRHLVVTWLLSSCCGCGCRCRAAVVCHHVGRRDKKKGGVPCQHVNGGREWVKAYHVHPPPPPPPGVVNVGRGCRQGKRWRGILSVHQEERKHTVFVYPVHVQWGWGAQKGLHVPLHMFMLVHKVGWRVPKKRGSSSVHQRGWRAKKRGHQQVPFRGVQERTAYEPGRGFTWSSNLGDVNDSGCGARAVYVTAINVSI